ncbi:hypothetical protein JW960_01810 [candidate division KSB1 bacterium]|nr:hypothetical protein [candidate division KSB1 bacterium]
MEAQQNMEKKFIDLIDHQKDINFYNKRKQNIFKKMVLKEDEIKIGDRKMVLSNSEHLKPVIKINKEGEVIQQIEITCKCGEKIFVDFKYE